MAVLVANIRSCFRILSVAGRWVLAGTSRAVKLDLLVVTERGIGQWGSAVGSASSWPQLSGSLGLQELDISSRVPLSKCPKNLSFSFVDRRCR